MRRRNIRTIVTSCLQKVRLDLQAWADKDQGNLHGLTLAQIPQTVWPQPFGKDGLERMMQGVTGLPSEQGDLPPLLPQQRGEGPRGKISALRSGQKDLLTWGRSYLGESPECPGCSPCSFVQSHGLPC